MPSPYIFGVSALLINPLTTGNPPTPADPLYLGTVQDVNVDFDQKLVDLRGQNKGPDDVAPSDITIKWKTGIGKIELDVFNVMAFGESVVPASTTAANLVMPVEAHAIPATPFTVTITPPNSGDWVADLGVINAANGTKFTRIPSGTPTAGQYTVTDGAYLFAMADNVSGITVLISYEYSVSSGWETLEVHNQIQGYGPEFEMFICEDYETSQGDMHLFRCKLSKWTAPHKRDGHLIADLEGEAYPLQEAPPAAWFEWVRPII